ncbi:YhbY domain RNA binding protein [Ligilactobacillus acidipiscis DSM 15836]|jgi:putative YhbY family RNA-binding protein|uniref:YhbY domain RNA binding protein n=1 Tax=Ligilactobacillus acidipiscis DSM 15836 TaxID=1423716 RepID=A0ABR5PLM1_9LACO|nr:ribosome assembly RNA-binding protein YhbY [Ligilactobacillus acidipiscis]KRM30293.1 YhbY domain RNA binding protein [Ligilactobacillus acidipiscis DSM 15836]MCI1924618.1 ribosome assembly RNA-binding protein YhbY [Ligilactobacillus acidipiscis]MCI1953900.1 ribosome assembly RNA-binding protein YhbY [Ligilactobacillus acidipiscis]WEV57943.1 ribosome assembly RNA-binding protein YhbY [Ligilactobacillus acidipiscis]GAW63895.1 RNA-binding protein [Ligilactobacillus acidipiscis]
MTLRGKQKRFLRSQAHDLRPLFQIGKDGLSENWLINVKAAIEKRELLKVSILQNSLVDEDEVIEFVENNSSIQVVQKIGHVLVLYKKASDKENRIISTEVEAI